MANETKAAASQVAGHLAVKGHVEHAARLQAALDAAVDDFSQTLQRRLDQTWQAMAFMRLAEDERAGSPLGAIDGRQEAGLAGGVQPESCFPQECCSGRGVVFAFGGFGDRVACFS